MALLEKGKIDSLATDRKTGKLVLFVFDEIGYEDELGHLTALQDKLNVYVNFYLNGQYKDFFVDIPQGFIIHICTLYKPSAKYKKYLKVFEKMIKAYKGTIELEDNSKQHR